MARTPATPAPAAPPPPAAPASMFGGLAPRRSLGLKLLLVCALALLMSIPALFVFALLVDRTNRAETVAEEVGGLMGGPQTFLGPVLAVPYTTPPAAADEAPGAGVWIVYPTNGSAEIGSRSEVRRRSLFEVPVYEADVNFTATFDFTDAGAAARAAGATLNWARAEFLMGASDARGARADVILNVGGRAYGLAPASLQREVLVGGAEARSRRATEPDSLSLFGMSAEGLIQPAEPLAVTGSMRFTGAQRIAVLAFAKTTLVSIGGDWAHPSFDGGFLPGTREAEGGAFTAEWSVPFIARGVPAQGGADTLSQLGAAEMGVSFVEPANPYQSVSRSLKYAPMFIGLVFLAFFLFETTTGRRVHPAQYILIGLAQVIFYMLLLSIAEHTGFDLAFALGAAATVALISAYAGWTFDSRAQGLRALVAFTFLYGLIYVLMRLEDYALLVGALTSFAAIAAVMYFTRRIDWYGVTGSLSEDKA